MVATRDLRKTYQVLIPKKTQVCNELLSKKINELNGKLNDLQASIEHSDEVNLEKFKVIVRYVSHISGTFRNHAKNTDD